ncbi:MAG: hypothetical protein WCT39_00960 [Candidatus Margulisiibacteriota bacterium]
MLSKKEKREILADGKDQKRRNNLKSTKNIKNYSLDNFLGFLKDFQNIFSLPITTQKHFISKADKL